MNSVTYQLPKPDKENKFSEFSIGTLLIREGKITAEEAEDILVLLDSKSMRFGEVAKELGMVTEDDIQEVLAKQFDYSFSLQRNKHFPRYGQLSQVSDLEVEFIRGLRTQLMLGWFKDEKKALAVSSVVQGSGNSELAANLAVSFSQLGKRTLLIDANLRRPKQQEIFDADPKVRGLSDVLRGSMGAEAIVRIKPIKNLSILYSGPTPPNPQELVGGSLFNDMVKFLNEIYDVIIIDTPAFADGADSQMIASAAGGVLLLGRKHYTKTADVTTIVNRLQRNGTEIVGTVVTEV